MCDAPLVVVAVLVDEPEDGSDHQGHGRNVQPHHRGEGVDEQQIPVSR